MNWEPVKTALVSLIAVIITTFVPLIFKLFFDMQSARLVKLKNVLVNNQLIAEKTVLLIQQTYGALTNSVKFQLAMKSIEKELGTLTFVALRDLLNTAVGTMHLVWGDAWTELALPPETTPTEPTPPVA